MRLPVVPRSWSCVGDAQVVPPGCTETIPAKIFETGWHCQVAIDVVGNHYDVFDPGAGGDVTFEHKYHMVCALCGYRVFTDTALPTVVYRSGGTIGHIVCFDCIEDFAGRTPAEDFFQLNEQGQRVFDARRAGQSLATVRPLGV